MKEQAYCRITWKIGFKKGHGEWHDISNKETLLDQIDELNYEHGNGTHKIQYDDGKSFVNAAKASLGIPEKRNFLD